MTNNNSDFFCGLIAGLVSNSICNPFDVIRTNKQLSLDIKYNYKFLSRGLCFGFITIPTYWSIYFECYKNLKETNKNKLYFLNGYIASNISSTITCPLWFIRQKNQICNNFEIYNFYKKNGIKPFYNALFYTYLINGSFIIQMPVYEKLKENKNINLIIKNDNLKIFTITLIAKTIATCFFYPIDTIRTIKRNNFNENTLSIIKKLNKNPLYYYSGITIYLIRSIPYHTSTFCTFEYCKKKNKNKI